MCHFAIMSRVQSETIQYEHQNTTIDLDVEDGLPM
jgi:hypothetical protein